MKFKAKLSIVTNYYNIQGLTEGDLRQQMDSLGPTDSYGRHDAYTTTRTSLESSNKVQFFKLNVIFTFPKWDNSSSTDPNLNLKWARYIRFLRKHEYGHRDIAIKTAQELNDALYVSGKFVGYNKQKSDGIINKNKLQDVNYDLSTGHGRTQGAIFP